MRRSPSARSVALRSSASTPSSVSRRRACGGPESDGCQPECDQAARLEPAQGAVERARVGVVEAEGREAARPAGSRGHRPRAAGAADRAEEVLGQARAQRVWHTVPVPPGSRDEDDPLLPAAKNSAVSIYPRDRSVSCLVAVREGGLRRRPGVHGVQQPIDPRTPRGGPQSLERLPGCVERLQRLFASAAVE